MPRILADAFEQQASIAAPEDPERALELHHAAAEHPTRARTQHLLPRQPRQAGLAGRHHQRPDRATRLLSASHQARAAIGYPRPPIDQPSQPTAVRCTCRARRRRSTRTGAAGEHSPSTPPSPTPAAARGSRERPSTGWASLTPTEREVAELAARGATNPDIASRLFMSRGTVKTHLSHVYAKLGISNRTELAAHAQPSEPRSTRPSTHPLDWRNRDGAGAVVGEPALLARRQRDAAG